MINDHDNGPLKLATEFSVKNFPTGDNWLQGAIVKVSGPLSFHVKLQDGRIVR